MTDLVKRKKLSDQVADRIKSYIVENRLKPGDRLPTEHALADRFGVSRISVREATKALEFLGIINAAPRRGLSIGEVNMSRVTQYLGFHFAINDFPPEQLIDTRIILETGALPHAMRRIQEDNQIYVELMELSDKLRDAKELQDWIDYDIAFHRQLLDASGLSPLVAFNDLLQVFFLQFRESVQQAEWSEGIRSHARILDHLQSQDLESAVEELTNHIASHKARI